MSELKPRITENGIDYILVGDYYIPDLKLPEEHRPIGKYGRMHREYLREVHPARFSILVLNGELWTYLADLNEQAQERLDTIMEQMKATEGVTEELKRTSQINLYQNRYQQYHQSWHTEYRTVRAGYRCSRVPRQLYSHKQNCNRCKNTHNPFNPAMSKEMRISTAIFCNLKSQKRNK